MNTRTTSDAEQQALPGLECEALLQSEIEFWQSVIKTCPATQSSESLERMCQALALAETRLARLSMASLTSETSYPRNQ